MCIYMDSDILAKLDGSLSAVGFLVLVGGVLARKLVGLLAANDLPRNCD